MREFIDISDVISSPHRSAYESFLQLDRFHGKIPFDPETGFYRLARESLHFSRTFPPQPFRGKEIPTYPAAKSAAGREPLCRHCIEYVLDMLLPDSGEGSAVVFSDLFHPATKDRLAASGERLSADAIERIREHNLECLDRKRGKPFGRIKVLITADDSESEGAGEIIRQIADSGEEFDAKKFERHVRGGMECVGYSVRFPWERSGERTEPDGYARRLEDYEAKCRRHGRSLRVAVYVDLEVRVDKALVYENHRWEKSSFPQRFRCYIGAFPLFTSRSTFLFATVRGNVERVPVLQLLPRERLEESEGETQIDRHCLTAMRVRTFADHLESVVKRALKTGSKWVEGDFAKDGENFKPDLMKVAVALESGLSRLISGRVCRVFNSLNPLSEISQKREITLRGPGGVSGQRATFDHRAVHWSHSGRICLTETPESEDIGLNLYLALAAKVDGDRLLAPHTELRENGVKGNTRWLGAEEESRPDCVVAPKDPFVRGRRDRVLARTMGSRVAWLEPGLVSHTEKYHGQMLGIGANLIPFVQHDDNN
ncbi:MAG: hypothetical protein LLG06_15755, partial [Desulfobacteraceae bacterium]|nr:hypothetical protein [Desulfobacteraceae bacterium]